MNLDESGQLASAILSGDRRAVALGLNLLDDQRPEARAAASRLLTRLQGDNAATKHHLIGLTGPPGVGKSSLTGALIAVWRKQSLRVGVLAVDPSSPISGGALLGDRLRMLTGTGDDGVFIRSLSNRGQFGGVSAEVWPMSLLMLAAFDVVLVETVGVGQREVDISSMCDTTCYVAQPGSGDSVQFIKAGILEVPHVVVVNKADLGSLATRTLSELSAAISREHPDGNWQVPVIATSATRGSGIAEMAELLAQHHAALLAAGDLEARRRRYQANWLLKYLEQEFGRAGIRQLGGEERLLERLATRVGSPYEQYDLLKVELAAGPAG